MKSKLILAIFITLSMRPVSAQDIRVYSEFRRVDPYGNIVTADRGGTVREILSPALARNAFGSLRVAVTPRPNTPTWLYVQQNPEAFKINLYRERYVRIGKQWFPDGLQSVQTPSYLILPEPQSEIPNQKVQSYWMDIWVPENARVERIRVEVLIKSGEDWIFYPMEVRIMPQVLPRVPPLGPPLFRIVEPVAANAVTILADCGQRDTGARGVMTGRQLVVRNARQIRAFLEENPELAEIVQGDLECNFRDRKLFDPEAILNVRRKLFTRNPLPESN